jgi:hypothetical protein
MYKVDTGNYPTQNQGLEALSVEIEVADSVVWGGPWMERVYPDPWGNDYIYVFPGKNSREGFDLYTLGEDGETATAGNDPDDINNWDPESGRSYYKRTEITERTVIRRIGVLVIALLALLNFMFGVFRSRRKARRESS